MVITGSGQTGGQQTNEPPRAVHTPDRFAGHGHNPGRPEPQAKQAPAHASSGWGEAPLALYLQNVPQFVLTLVAAWKLGGGAQPGSTTWSRWPAPAPRPRHRSSCTQTTWP